MAKPDHILLETAKGSLRIPILFENRSVLALDKPAHWLIAPPSWRRTTRNLQAALVDSIRLREHWAASRNLRFLRYIHRLDAETSGILLCAKSQGALPVYSRLFESRQMRKTYLAVAAGRPPSDQWTCTAPLGPDPLQKGRTRVALREGKEAVTHFQVLARGSHHHQPLALIAARPVTGRTHQIRVHLCEAQCPVLGDPLYPASGPSPRRPPPAERAASRHLALRSVELSFTDPFEKKPVRIRADWERFLRRFHFPDVDPGIGNRIGAEET